MAISLSGIVYIILIILNHGKTQNMTTGAENIAAIPTETESNSSCIPPENIRVFNALYSTQLNWTSRFVDNDPSSVFTILLSSYHHPVIINEKSSEHSGSAILMAIERYCPRILDSDDNSTTSRPVGTTSLQQYTFDIILANDHCNAPDGMQQIMDIVYATPVDVIIGMACSETTTPAGYFLSYHDVPLISHASNAISMNDKSTYTTLVRMGLGFKHIGLAFLDMFRKFQWNRAVAFVTRYGLCEYASSSIQRVFLDNRVSMPDWLLFEPENFNDELLRETVKSIKQRARVIYVCFWRNANLVQFMDEVKRQGMLTPDYVYFTTVISFIDDGMRHPWTIGAEPREHYTDEEWEARKDIYQSLRIVTTPDFKSPEDYAIQTEFHLRNQQPPFNWNLSHAEPPRNGRIETLYDITSHWLYTVDSALAEGTNPRSGSNIFRKMINSSFQGVTGKVVMDATADRITPYILWQYKPGEEEYTKVAHAVPFNPANQRVTFVPGESIDWRTPDGQPPPDTPPCGFFNEFCPPEVEPDYTIAILVGCFGGLALLFIGGFILNVYLRKKRYADDIQRMLWKIPVEVLEFSSKNKSESMGTRSAILSSRMSMSTMTGGGQIFMSMALYRGNTVAVKKLHIPDFFPDKQGLILLKEVKDLSHDNVNTFYGLAMSLPTIYMVTSYCSKGSLLDVLENDEIKLDKAFKISLTSDLANGLKFIHDSSLSSHGRLRSSCCLITSRWVLKIANAGINWLKDLDQGPDKVSKQHDLLWTAPELLRMEQPPVEGTQKADVYSFGIIMQEILFRAPPFFDVEMTADEIIDRVKKESDTPFRPTFQTTPAEVSDAMLDLMQSCWDEIPTNRPTLSNIIKEIIKFNDGRKINIMDNMVQKLETYANNLEDIVAARTEALVLEKKKTDQLLYRMLPQIVAERLKVGETVAPELFDSATVYFSDVVGFTSISARSLPIQVVDLLNDLYTCFDSVIEKFDVYKVETIGDAYMCVSGIPLRNGNRHAAEICNMALALRNALATFKIRHLPEQPLHIRIGVHTGPCAAGVVGLTMPRYCLFGDTVNTASRMESNSEAMKIHLSEQAHDALSEIGGYHTALRGEIPVKGKGTCKTYWLHGLIEDEVVTESLEE